MNARHTGPVFRVSRLEPCGKEGCGVKVYYHPVRVPSASLKHGVKKGDFKLYSCIEGVIKGFVHGNDEATIRPCGDSKSEITWHAYPYETVADFEAELDTFDILYDLTDCQATSPALGQLQKEWGQPKVCL